MLQANAYNATGRTRGFGEPAARAAATALRPRAEASKGPTFAGWFRIRGLALVLRTRRGRPSRLERCQIKRRRFHVLPSMPRVALAIASCRGAGRPPRRGMTAGSGAASPATATAGAAATGDRASTGVDGLDHILGGGLSRNRLYLLEGTPGTGKTTFALRFLMEGASARRARPLHHALGNRRGARGGSRIAWLVARQHRRVRAGQRERRRSRRRAVDPLSVGGRARRDDPHAHRADRERGAVACRPRQPLGDAPARAGPAALSAPGARAQAVLQHALVHGAAARRQDLRTGRPAAAQHLARRDQPRADDPGVRHREPPPAGGEDARAEVPGRLARLPPRHRPRRRVPAPGRLAAPHRRFVTTRSAPARPSST